ncbi:unnamed protein product, partial [Fusarium fujikuroi]
MMLIIHHIYQGKDKPSIFAFFVLCQVSRRFRRLARDRKFLSHIFSNKDCCGICSQSTALWQVSEDETHLDNSSLTKRYRYSYEKHCFSHKINREDSEGLSDLVRNEKLCTACKEGLEARRKLGVSLTCKFAARHSGDWEFCTACKVEHTSFCFSAGQKVCIAKTGYIRLCEHKVIYWKDFWSLVEDRMSDKRKRKSDTITVCRHPSHRMTCSYGSFAPKAVLAGEWDRPFLSLTFEGFQIPIWLQYRIPMVTTGRMSVREKGAKYIAPERMSGWLPEIDSLFFDENS